MARKSATLLLALAVAFAAIASTSGAGYEIWKAYNWKEVYNAYPQTSGLAAWGETSVNCTGPYSLCAKAQCRIVTLGSNGSPAIAECGCYGYPKAKGKAAINYGGWADMLSKESKDASSKACGTTPNKCWRKTNVAPVCAQQNNKPKPSEYGGIFDIISTWNPKTWPTNTAAMHSCSAGQYTNCYSAGCLNVKPFNYKSTGANVTCYCPVYNVQKGQGTFFNANPDKNCYGSKGFAVGSVVYNGLGLTAKGR